MKVTNQDHTAGCRGSTWNGNNCRQPSSFYPSSSFLSLQRGSSAWVISVPSAPPGKWGLRLYLRGQAISLEEGKPMTHSDQMNPCFCSRLLSISGTLPTGGAPIRKDSCNYCRSQSQAKRVPSNMRTGLKKCPVAAARGFHL